MELSRDPGCFPVRSLQFPDKLLPKMVDRSAVGRPSDHTKVLSHGPPPKSLGWERDIESYKQIQTLHRVRVRTLNRHKKRPAQPEWPKQDRKILRQCMSRSPYKPQTSSEDKGRRAMESFHGPQTHVPEGACAIKVSMKCSDAKANDYIPCNCARTSSSRVKID